MPQAQPSDLLMFILDVLRYDTEKIENIVALLNNAGTVGWRFSWPRDFTRDEVVAAIGELLERGDISALDFDSDPRHVQLVEVDHRTVFPEHADRLWYRLTDHGRARWEAWEDYPEETVG